MTHAPFNPSQAVRFDLGPGQIVLDGASRRVVVPPELVQGLCRSAGDEAARDFGRQLGTEIGRRVAARLGDGAGEATSAAVVEHLGGDLALAGLGSLAVERWGRALVLRITGCPFDAEGDALMSAVVEGALQRAFARDASAVPLDRQDGQLRLLCVSPSTAAAVTQWLQQGTGWGDVLARLNEGQPTSG